MAAGRLYGVETVLVRTGIGPENAGAAAERVFDTFEVSEVLVSGFGGAARSDLGPGNLIGCSEVVDLTGNSVPVRLDSSSFLLERARRTDRLLCIEAAATVPRIISSAKEKQTLGLVYGIAVVEMEGFPLFDVSGAHGVPAFMIRAVLDAVDEDLPDTTRLLTESGEPRLNKIVTHLAGRPGDAAFFSTLRKRIKMCRRALDAFLEHYLLLRG
jgi:4-hydroxy-3-methylbut-2-enyl diphosphate reductase